MFTKTLLSIVVCAFSFNALAGPGDRDAASAVPAKNIVRLSPITAFGYVIGGGLSYERILDKGGKIGLHIPVYAGINTNGDYYGNQSFNPQVTNYAILLNPGVKFYPMGQNKTVTYALGASLFTMFGRDDYYNGSSRVENAMIRAGVFINNYIQFNITPKLNVGMELGIGPSYIEQYRDRTTNITESYGMSAIAQFGFHVGYRF